MRGLTGALVKCASQLRKAAPMNKTERITCEDVRVGDRIARTRTAVFLAVEAIDEGPVARRLHFAREACPEPDEWRPSESGRYCAACHLLAGQGHGNVGGGNIRPRRTAKLWRVV